MVNIKRIIREEIDRFLMAEAIDFRILNQLGQQLNNALAPINSARNDSSYGQELIQYFNNFITYCVQIIAAIRRCNQAQTLNEVNWGGLSNYGINLPGHLGGNLWNDAKRGFYGTRNWVIDKQNKRNGQGANTNTNINPNTVPSVKLSVLLNQISQKQQEYGNYNTQFGIATKNPQVDMQFHQILDNGGIIPQIANEYQRQLGNNQNNNNQQTP